MSARRLISLALCCSGFLVDVTWAQVAGPDLQAEHRLAQAAPDPATESLVLDLRLNGTLHEGLRPILRRGGRYLLAQEDVLRLRLVPPQGPAARHGGIAYIDLHALGVTETVLDEPTQTLAIQVPTDAFAGSSHAADLPMSGVHAERALGAFVAYEWSLQHDARGSSVSGLVEGVASGRWGVLSSSLLAGSAVSERPRSTVRLDTVFQRDDPQAMTRLSIGDGINQAAAWSSPFRFGGVQFGTRFDLRPGYITYPTPSLQGGAAVPSSVEVFVNEVLRYQGRIDPGPFRLSNVPVLTGAGNMRYAMTDAGGQSRVVNTPYYVSASLLKSGLSDYSVELGRLRRRYGEAGFDYGKPFASGSWRRGMSDRLTLELHGEASARLQVAGAGLAAVAAPWGEVGLHLAASRDAEKGTGHLARASFARSSEHWNFSATRQVASGNFNQLAWQDAIAPTRSQTMLFVGRNLGALGSVGASYTRLGYGNGNGTGGGNGEKVGLLSASWSVAVGERAWLAASITRTMQSRGPAVNGIGLSLSFALGDRYTASTSVRREGGRMQASVDAARNTVEDQDWGWRVGAAGGDNPRSEASIDWRGRHASLGADAVSSGGEHGLRLRASGAVGWTGGMLFAARPSEDGFALVTVPGAPAGTRIYRENQLAARTDATGRAIVPGLRAYQVNHLGIDVDELPIESGLRSDKVEVVPARRGFTHAAFDISQTTRVVAIVRLPDGRPLPAGLDLRSKRRLHSLVSGFDGKIEVADPMPGERFVVRLDTGSSCRIDWGRTAPARPRANGEAADLPVYTCEPASAASSGEGE
ncbi:putative fimbrial usher protein [Burkholderiales bacterium 8X]|nr:putative fimbrial usher protein [Burkholderiales bacterium 8X]